MSTHPYKHMHAHPTPMSTSKRLSRLDFVIHEVGHQECFTVDGDIASPTERIIRRKCNTHIKYKI
jgi:hypothetical protein